MRLRMSPSLHSEGGRTHSEHHTAGRARERTHKEQNELCTLTFIIARTHAHTCTHTHAKTRTHVRARTHTHACTYESRAPQVVP